MEDFSFEDLIAPAGPESFFTEYWEKRILCGREGSEDKFRHLVTLADVEFLVYSLTSTSQEWIQLLSAKQDVFPPAEYLTKESFINLSKVHDAYHSGYTIQLAKLHKRWEPIGRLCRSVEGHFTRCGVALSNRIGSHLYLTPKHSKGSLPHYDNHNVIVLQIEGTKVWRIYGALEASPIARQGKLMSKDELPQLQSEVELRAGQALYVPRGFYHEAETSDSYSLHITLDIYPYTWVDLISRLLLSKSKFREALPIGFGTIDSSWPCSLKQYEERIQFLREGEDLKAIYTELLKDFIEKLDPLPDDGFEQIHALESVNLNTRVGKRRGTFAHVLTNGEQLQLRFPGSGFGGPRLIEPVFRFLADTPHFTVHEMPDLLSDESKIQMVKDLIRDGFLKILEP